MDPADALRKLKSSDLFSKDYPKRGARPSAGEKRPGQAAIERSRDFRSLEDLVRTLGQARYEPAVPALSTLWRACALVPVRNAAGHAPRSIGTEPARNALLALIDDPQSGAPKRCHPNIQSVISSS